MTERENFMRVVNGEFPEWVPVYSDACDLVVPSLLTRHLRTEEKIDCFGTKWTFSDGAPMISPDSPKMEDISEWRERVNFPHLSDEEWAQMAAEDTKNFREDTVKIVKLLCNGTIFLPLMGMMGFEDGLMAMLVDPEEVEAFNEAVTCRLEDIIHNVIRFYKPDIIMLGEDIATENDLFFSPEIFYEMYLPKYERLCKICRDAGIIIEWHICGKVDKIIDDLIAMGPKIWQPAQVMNDIDAIMERYGNKLTFNGLFDTRLPGCRPGATEEECRMSTRACLDRYGKTGRLVFFDGLFGDGSEAQRKAWMVDEARKYGHSMYK